ncbi:periplasmic heavy metal sensor [Shimia ponticola]|uniref:periplasmic heavy metal sensor n=1 Tax=Shimia ponticola TaxID=2582893 RepID=UPI0011BD4893|nr:periplasmic heavy metal sensor [Shimia ponticola]
MADAQSKRPRVSGGWRIVLVISLALNILVLGMVAGAFLRGHDDRPNRRPPPVGSEIGVAPILKALEPEDRRAMGRAVFREARRDPDRRAETRARLAEMAAILRAEPVDEAALQDLLGQYSEDAMARHQNIQRVLIDTLSAKSPQERAALAARLEDFAENGIPKRRKHGDKDR